VNLRDYFQAIATAYRRDAGLRTPTQDLLRRADEELADFAPGGITIIGSGGKGVATFTPWVGFFNPDETTNPQEGIYIVYLLSEDLAGLTLTLNQGMEYLRKRVGDSAARQRLAQDAETIRNAFPPQALAGLATRMDLTSVGARQRNYEAGNIASLPYATATLPPEAELEADLRRFLDLYEQAIELKRQLLLGAPGSLASPSGSAAGTEPDPLRDFKPKDDSDYQAHIIGKKLRKSRRHETLVRKYGEWVATRGYAASTTEFPKDLVLRRTTDEWLAEIKVVYLGNATEAVRAALGQLYTYRYFQSSRDSSVRLLAVFTETIGLAYAEFLASCDVEAVWWESGLWVGTPGAVSADLAEIAY